MLYRFTAVIISILLLLGCAGTKEQQIPPDVPKPSPSPTNTEPSPIDEDKPPSIAGVSLGDTTAKVSDTLGSNFKANHIEEGGYFGEPYQERTYQNGLRVLLGKQSGKVLQIMSTDPNTTTELDVRIGDQAESVLQKYRTKYQEPVSQHGSGKLEGWFEVGDGQLMIFDFDAQHETMVNQNIDKGAQVERIILAYSKFMD